MAESRRQELVAAVGALRLDACSGSGTASRRVRGAVRLPAVVIVLAFLYPYYNESLPDIPVFGSFRASTPP